MELESTFEVPAPPEEVWEYLLDVERVAPCMPGAELTEAVDERAWKGRVNVKLGAISLTYSGKVEIQERDDTAHRIVFMATGAETRGKGTARATVTSVLAPAGDGGTRVEITTDLALSGAAAQYARGMLGDVSAKLTGQFADCVRQQLLAFQAPAGEGATPGPPPEAGPISGARLALYALWQAIVRLVRRLARPGRRSR